MKTGIMRRVDDLGRVVIPKEIRKTMQIEVGDALEISMDGNMVCFEKYVPAWEYEKQITSLINRIMDDDETPDSLKVITLLEQARAVLLKTDE